MDKSLFRYDNPVALDVLWRVGFFQQKSTLNLYIIFLLIWKLFMLIYMSK